MAVTILDGPLGTELNARGVGTPLPGWSAHALITAPGVVGAIHRDYASAGATVHTANTFRTKRRQFPAEWERLARLAVRICRESIPAGHRVAGSVAPLEDCYRPDLSPPADVARAEHRELAMVLADAGCDVLLCETFPHAEEAIIALEACVATGLPVWVSFTPGPDGTLLTPKDVGGAAREAIRRGAAAVLVNCVAAPLAAPYVRALAEAAGGAPFGVYANAGRPDDRIGWQAPEATPDAAARYADLAGEWVAMGATLVGSCCGTRPGHVAELARRFGGEPRRRGGTE